MPSSSYLMSHSLQNNNQNASFLSQQIHPISPQNLSKLPIEICVPQPQSCKKNKKILQPVYKSHLQKFPTQTTKTFNPIVLGVLNDSLATTSCPTKSISATNCASSTITTTQKSEINFNTCAICGASFRITTDLVQHMRFNHRITKYKRKNSSTEKFND